MGRHSAPGDDEDESTDVAVLTQLLAEEPVPAGRHAGSGTAAPDEPAELPDGQPDVLPDGPSDEQPDTAEVTAVPVDAAPAPAADPSAPDAPEVPEVPEMPGVPDAAPAAPARAPHSTAGDLALIRRHSDVRARCLAGLVVPFVLYFAVMFAVAATGRQLLLWIFVPLIVAGVLIGYFLDAGHKRHAA